MGRVSTVICDFCGGEGYLLGPGQPGVYSYPDEAFLPSEPFSACPECDGEGKLEVCATCHQPFVIFEGVEACTCIRLRLSQAA